MSTTSFPSIETLFAPPGRRLEQPVDFEWRVIRRKGRPFLLLPPAAGKADVGLNLYSAQRRRAKIIRGLLPAMLGTPAAALFERFHLRAEASSEIMQFMAQQTNMPVEEICLVAIKLSEVEHRSRLVILLCDEIARPTRVIKAGLNATGRAAIDQEADFLQQLPPSKLGCIHMTGRLSTPTTSAFATDFFPGASPCNDAGMEHLFHAWLDSGGPIPLESLPTWQKLSNACGEVEPWPAIRRMLAGKHVRTTLYHGDFAPWNVRVVNSQNLQAFDWERGSLRGIPGWDWFHFIIQTSILARRYPAERTAAEVEQLIHSPQFAKYARVAGIGDIVRPLVLAYLLHQRWVIKPFEGGQTADAVLEFLSAHWRMNLAPAAATPLEMAANSPPAGSLPTARLQLKSAVSQWNNLFWEPSLNSSIFQPLFPMLLAKWRAVLATLSLSCVAVVAQFFSSPRLMFLTFHLFICGLATWKVDRRWGSFVALIAAFVGPLLFAANLRLFGDPGLLLWNIVMRLVLLQSCVFLVDRLCRQKPISIPNPPIERSPKFAEVWATVFACIAVFVIIALLDWKTNPYMTFLPLYLLPCTIITLAVGLRWGIVATIISAFVGVLLDYLTVPQYTLKDFSWNFVMRCIVYLLLLVLVDRLRAQSVHFRRMPANLRDRLSFSPDNQTAESLK